MTLLNLMVFLFISVNAKLYEPLIPDVSKCMYPTQVALEMLKDDTIQNLEACVLRCVNTLSPEKCKAIMFKQNSICVLFAENACSQHSVDKGNSFYTINREFIGQKDIPKVYEPLIPTTSNPAFSLSNRPNKILSQIPSNIPSQIPSNNPTQVPSDIPTQIPSKPPTSVPSTSSPTSAPTEILQQYTLNFSENYEEFVGDLKELFLQKCSNAIHDLGDFEHVFCIEVPKGSIKITLEGPKNELKQVVDFIRNSKGFFIPHIGLLYLQDEVLEVDSQENKKNKEKKFLDGDHTRTVGLFIFIMIVFVAIVFWCDWYSRCDQRIHDRTFTEDKNSIRNKSADERDSEDLEKMKKKKIRKMKELIDLQIFYKEFSRVVNLRDIFADVKYTKQIHAKQMLAQFRRLPSSKNIDDRDAAIPLLVNQKHRTLIKYLCKISLEDIYKIRFGKPMPIIEDSVDTKLNKDFIHIGGDSSIETETETEAETEDEQSEKLENETRFEFEKLTIINNIDKRTPYGSGMTYGDVEEGRRLRRGNLFHWDPIPVE